MIRFALLCVGPIAAICRMHSSTIAAASAHTGIHRRTIERWLKRGVITRKQGKVSITEIEAAADTPKSAGRRLFRHAWWGGGPLPPYCNPRDDGLKQLFYVLCDIGRYYRSTARMEEFQDVLAKALGAVRDTPSKDSRSQRRRSIKAADALKYRIK